MDRAVENNDRFLVERNGEPAVLILSIAGYVKALAPAALAQRHPRRRQAEGTRQADFGRR